MTRKAFLISTGLVLSALLTACGTVAIPEYQRQETAVAVALVETNEAQILEGEIVPTATVEPSPTVDFEATAAAEEQAAADAQATIDAEEAANAQATADAEAAAQAEADAQATADAEAVAQAGAVPGSDDPLFDAIQAADPANGEMIFNGLAVPACNSCHLVDSENMLVGPGQLNLLARTIERIENGAITDAGPYTYIYNSIINPGDYIVETFSNAMPDIYEGVLTDEQLYDLVAYLASLEG